MEYSRPSAPDRNTIRELIEGGFSASPRRFPLPEVKDRPDWIFRAKTAAKRGSGPAGGSPFRRIEARYD